MTVRWTVLSRWILPIVGSALAVVLIFWLYRDLDVAHFLTVTREAEVAWLIPLGATILFEQLVRSWKWRQILFDLKPIPTLRLFGAVLAGYGAAAVVPLGISPLVRAWLIARLEGLRMAAVLVTTAIERFVDGMVFALIAGFVAVAAALPAMDGDARTGLMIAGGLSFFLFAGLMRLLFLGRSALVRDESWLGRAVDRVASWGGARFAGLRDALAEGIVWPRSKARRVGVVAAAMTMKAVAATHFVWSGLAVGVLLEPMDYLFLMVVAGFALVLARFVRVPGGCVIGAGFALHVLGVPAEDALAMILFNHILSLVLVVGLGLTVLWRSGIEIRTTARALKSDTDGTG